MRGDDLVRIANDAKLRNDIVENGFEIKKSKSNRYFEGRYIVPYDKGGESDSDDGLMPNYFVPTNYYIDWSSDSVKRMQNMTIADRIRLYNEDKTIQKHYEHTLASVKRNSQFYFVQGLTYSRTGVYSPTFRINSCSVYDVKGSFIEIAQDNLLSLGLLSSRIVKFLVEIIFTYSRYSN
ncbi:MAG: hypothetical protein IPL09_07475 [Bacteroidetes bacterium]|nr:hypothetical protein [Bacteroidota bacterium]